MFITHEIAVETIGYLERDFRAGEFPNESERQVRRPATTAATEDLAIDMVDLISEIDLMVFLPVEINMRPMGRTAASVEQPHLRKQIGCAADEADTRPSLQLPTKPG